MAESLILPRLYPILDTSSLATLGLKPVEAAEVILGAGARILQIRHKSHWTREAFAQAQQIARLCREANALFVVNDRADYAQVLSAALHLGQDDLLPADARKVVAGETIIGFSTHNAGQARLAESEPVDYIAFGPIFTTASKHLPDPVTGAETLRSIRTLTKRPLVAIGGITRDNASICWNAGADSVAVIADLFPPAATLKTLRERMNEWQQLTNQ